LNGTERQLKIKAIGRQLKVLCTAQKKRQIIMADVFDIFDIKPEDIQVDDEKKGESSLYTPKPDKGRDGVYTSLVRFLPDPYNPRKPYLSKYVYWLEDQDGKGFYADAPSTVGEKDQIQDLFFKLRNSESAVDKQLSEGLKRKAVYYGLVYIVKDENNPDLEGKIKVWKFTWKIKEKIEAQLKPKFDDPVNIFDPFDGKDFQIEVYKKGGWPNYDRCEFLSRNNPIKINGKHLTDTPEDKANLIGMLKDSPKLSDFGYKPWDEDTRNRVNDVLSMYLNGGGKDIDALTNNVNTKFTPSDELTNGSEDLDESDFSFSSDSSSDEEDLDDFLEDLDL